MSTNLSQAQSAQQGNRTTDGKYTFGTHAEPDGLMLANRKTLRVPEDQTFDQVKLGRAEWTIDAAKLGAQKRFGVTGEQIAEATEMAQKNARHDACEKFGLDDRGLSEMTCTDNNNAYRFRDFSPYLVGGGNFSNKEWAALAVSGIGHLPVERVNNDSVFQVIHPTRHPDLIRVLENGTLQTNYPLPESTNVQPQLEMYTPEPEARRQPVPPSKPSWRMRAKSLMGLR